MIKARLPETTEEALFIGSPYRCLGRLGAGATGTVYLVEHQGIRRKFVAKVIHKSLVPDAKALDRFRLEAQSLGHVNHPHIVSVEGTGTTADERPFLVLEYLVGHTLGEEIRASDISVTIALEYTRQILSALGAAHQARVVHRDLKPNNIFVTTGPLGKPVLKILDFGLVKILPNASTNAPSPLVDPTTGGNALGTPSYMSPEQALGRDVDERSDLYATALLLYKMLTGVGPFEHLGRDRQMDAHIQEEPAPPSLLSKQKVSKRLDRVILKALSKDPKERYPSAAAFWTALQAASSLENSQTRTSVQRASWRLFLLIVLLTMTLAITVEFLLLR